MLKVITEPSTEPVTLAEAKLHCKIEVDDDDAEVAIQIKAARRRCESRCKRAFVSTGLRYTLDEFPQFTPTDRLRQSAPSQIPIKLPRPPLISVESITYVDTAGVTQTLSSSLYRVLDGHPGRVVPIYGSSWPSTRAQHDAVTVNYTAGYGAAAAVPETLKLAILMLVAYWYVNREAGSIDTMTELPLSVKSLLNAESWGFYA